MSDPFRLRIEKADGEWLQRKGLSEHDYASSTPTTNVDSKLLDEENAWDDREARALSERNTEGGNGKDGEDLNGKDTQGQIGKDASVLSEGIVRDLEKAQAEEDDTDEPDTDEEEEQLKALSEGDAKVQNGKNTLSPNLIDALMHDNKRLEGLDVESDEGERESLLAALGPFSTTPGKVF